MLPLGISVASSTRIGNCLGAQCPNRARFASRAALILALAFASFNSCLLIAVRSHWGYLWTNDPTVVTIVQDILPLAAVFQFSDALGAVGGGILRGCGHQKTGAMINIFGYYVLGLPVGVLLAFKAGFGLMGLWLGLTCGIFIVSCVLMMIIFRMDWILEADRALDLLDEKDDFVQDAV